MSMKTQCGIEVEEDKCASCGKETRAMFIKNSESRCIDMVYVECKECGFILRDHAKSWSCEGTKEEACSVKKT